VPLFFALKDKRPTRAFFLSFLCGVVFFAITIFWLMHVTLLGVIVLILYLALYFGVFGLIFSIYYSRSAIYPVVFLSSVWALLEYSRSYLLTGFGWALLGYSQYLTLPVIQIADVTGVWGVSFVVMVINIAIFTILNKRKSLSAAGYLLPVVILTITLGYGFFRLSRSPAADRQPPVKISVIQGNIPQELKWQSNQQGFILGRYIWLSTKAAKDKPDLIVWPEASSPGFLGEDDWIFDDIFSLARSLDTNLLLGTVVVEEERYFNSAILINGRGEISGRYDKIHLVPFGEYIPLKKIFGFLNTIVPIGEASKGKAFTLFDSGKRKFGVLICFEDLFPELSRNFVKKGADFMLNITNDGWYGKTSSHYQHLSASVFRAVENHVYVIRSANTGISCFIDPKGEVIARVEDSAREDRFIAGYKTLAIEPERKKGLTFYTRYGELFLLLVCFLALYGIIRYKRIPHG
jgi:apolipoprotein N-acyltransferase